MSAEARRPIGFWLKLVDSLLDERFATSLAEHGIDRRQWQLLNVLKGGAMTYEQLDQALAPFLLEDAETTIEHLAPLVDRSWVTGTDHAELTELGRSALSQVGEDVDELRTASVDGIDDEAFATTLGTLETVARNLGWDDD